MKKLLFLLFSTISCCAQIQVGPASGGITSIGGGNSGTGGAATNVSGGTFNNVTLTTSTLSGTFSGTSTGTFTGTNVGDGSGLSNVLVSVLQKFIQTNVATRVLMVGDSYADAGFTYPSTLRYIGNFLQERYGTNGMALENFDQNGAPAFTNTEAATYWFGANAVALKPGNSNDAVKITSSQSGSFFSVGYPMNICVPVVSMKLFWIAQPSGGTFLATNLRSGVVQTTIQLNGNAAVPVVRSTNILGAGADNVWAFQCASGQTNVLIGVEFASNSVPGVEVMWAQKGSISLMTMTNVGSSVLSSFGTNVAPNAIMYFARDDGEESAILISNLLDSVLTQFSVAGTRVAVISAPPAAGVNRQTLADANAALKNACVVRGWTFVDLYADYPNFPRNNTAGLINSDGIHPNENGQQAWGASVLSRLNEIASPFNSAIALGNLQSTAITNNNQPQVTVKSNFIISAAGNGINLNPALQIIATAGDGSSGTGMWLSAGTDNNAYIGPSFYVVNGATKFTGSTIVGMDLATGFDVHASSIVGTRISAWHHDGSDAVQTFVDRNGDFTFNANTTNQGITYFPTNVAPFTILTNDLSLNALFTNRPQRSILQFAVTLISTNIANNQGAVAIVIDQNADNTYEATVNRHLVTSFVTGNAAGNTTNIVELFQVLQPNARFYITNLSVAPGMAIYVPSSTQWIFQ